MRIPAGLLLLASAGLILSFAFAAGDPPASSGRGVLLVANKGEHTLGIVDPNAGLQLATVPEDGITGHEVIASPDGRTAYVPIYGNSGVGHPGTDGQTQFKTNHIAFQSFDTASLQSFGIVSPPPQGLDVTELGEDSSELCIDKFAYQSDRR